MVSGHWLLPQGSTVNANYLIVLLRALEYFEGIMFLTTNRVGTIDPAFQSRIHLSMTYPVFSLESRLKLWKTFILKDSSATRRRWLNSKFLDEIGKEEVNGRQIENIVRMASSLAANEKREMKPDDIRVGLQALVTFKQDFSQAVETSRERARQDSHLSPQTRNLCENCSRPLGRRLLNYLTGKS